MPKRPITSKEDMQKAFDDTEQVLVKHDTQLNDFKRRMDSIYLRLGNGKAYSDPTDPQERSKFLGAALCKAAGKSREDTAPYLDKMTETTTDKALLGANTLVIDSTTGSYTIPEQYIGDVRALLTESSELFPLVTKIPLTSNSAKYPAKNAGVSFTRVTSDSTALTEASPTFSELDLDVETFALWISVTENFLDDNLAAIGDYFARLMQEAWVASYETCTLNNSANPVGLLTNTSVNNVTMGSGSSTFSSVDIDDLYDLVEALTTGVKRKGACFYMHPLVFDIIRMLRDADGNYLIAPWTENAGRKLFGYNVVLSDQMPSTSAVSTKFIAFGPPKELLYGDRLPLEIKFFGETAKAAQYTEVFFRARYRAAYAVGVPAAFSVLSTSGS